MTPLERRVDALDDRILAIEGRINELQLMLQTTVSRRDLTGTRVVIQDDLNAAKAEIDSLETQIQQIKQRLHIS